MSLRIYMNKVASASAPTTYSGFDALAKTTAYTAYAPTNWTNNSWYNTSDFASVLQEIINQGGWASGNNIDVLIMEQASTNGTYRQYYCYDGGAGNAPILTVTYTTSGGATVTASFLLSMI
jgi:hypothetical protein